MKLARISLSAAALVVTVVGAFAFNRQGPRDIPGTLYTANGTQHIDCCRGIFGNACPVSAYTKNGTQVIGARVIEE